MFNFSEAPRSNGRTFFVPAFDEDCTPRSRDATIEGLGTGKLRLRDVLDFTVDVTDWLEANNGVTLQAAVWTVGSDSDFTPTIIGQGFDPRGKTTCVLQPADGAVPGSDLYRMDITLTVAEVPSTTDKPFAIPQRIMTRRVNIAVVNG